MVVRPFRAIRIVHGWLRWQHSSDPARPRSFDVWSAKFVSRDVKFKKHEPPDNRTASVFNESDAFYFRTSVRVISHFFSASPRTVTAAYHFHDKFVRKYTTDFVFLIFSARVKRHSVSPTALYLDENARIIYVIAERKLS